MRKALLADDDFLVRSYLKMLSSWEKAGFEITADVRDGEEALEILEQQEIELVVTDIAMPLMDYKEILQSMGDAMIQAGYGEEGFTEAVLEREKDYPTGLLRMRWKE